MTESLTFDKKSIKSVSGKTADFNELAKDCVAFANAKKDGNFNFKIDGVSHVSWFRRKKDEFMKALGVPTRKQDKGIRL